MTQCPSDSKVLCISWRSEATVRSRSSLTGSASSSVQTASLTGQTLSGEGVSLARLSQGRESHWPDSLRGGSLTGQTLSGEGVSLARLSQGRESHWPDSLRGGRLTGQTLSGEGDSLSLSGQRDYIKHANFLPLCIIYQTISLLFVYHSSYIHCSVAKCQN